MILETRIKIKKFRFLLNHVNRAGFLNSKAAEPNCVFMTSDDARYIYWNNFLSGQMAFNKESHTYLGLKILSVNSDVTSVGRIKNH